jgi:type IV pilus assembly protein PilC
MATYQYLAYTAAGKRRRGALEAAAPSAAEDELWKQGLYLADLRAKAPRATLDELLPSVYHISRQELIMFTRQLATFVRAGIPMSRALQTIGAEGVSPLMRRVLGKLGADLEGGKPLSVAMAAQPRVFPVLYVELVRVAELTGNLERTLQQVAVYLKREIGALRKVRSALVYPAIVLVLAAGVTIFMAFFVLPQFVNIFKEFNVPLPLPTRILLASVEFLQKQVLWLAVGLGAIIVGLSAGLATRRGRWVKDWLMLKLPVLGPLTSAAALDRFARTLSLIIKSGVALQDGLPVVARSTGNAVFMGRLPRVWEQMQSGEGFAGPLARTGLFPPILTQMIRVGEETGTLDTYLDQAAEFYDEELDYRIRQMTSLIEPIMIVGVGLVVGFIAISLVSAMYGLVGAIK